MSAIALVKFVEIASLSNALFISGYHYGSDRIVLPNTLDARSLSVEDAVRCWFRAWDVGRIAGPITVNVSLLGYAILAFHEGIKGSNFALYALASGAQALNVCYTILGVFKLNDRLLAEHERVKAGKGVSATAMAIANIQDWKAMDQKRMLLEVFTASLGLVALLRK